MARRIARTRLLAVGVVLATAGCRGDAAGPPAATPSARDSLRTGPAVAVVERGEFVPARLVVASLAGAPQRDVTPQAFVVPPGTGAPSSPPAGARLQWISAVRWSPDGRRLAVAAQLPGSGRDLQVDYSVFVVPDTGGPALALGGWSRSLWDLDWAPDGRAVAFLAVDGTLGAVTRLFSALVVADAAGGGARTVLRADHRSISTRAGTTIPNEWLTAAGALRWGRDGRLYLASVIGCRLDLGAAMVVSRVYAVALEDGQARVVADSIPGAVVGIARAGDWALVAQSASSQDRTPRDCAAEAAAATKRLVRLDFATRRATTLVAGVVGGERLWSASLTADDARVLLVTNVAPTADAVDLRYWDAATDGADRRPVAGDPNPPRAGPMPLALRH